MTLAFVAIVLASCGSNSDSVTLKVESKLGKYGDFIAVDNSEVTVKLVEENENGLNMKAIVSSLTLQVKTAVASDFDFNLAVEVLDENHIKIGELPVFEVESETDFKNDLDYYLTAGTIHAQMKGETVAKNWKSEDQEMWEKICKEGAYIMIKPDMEDAKYAAYKASSDSEEVSDDDDDSVSMEESEGVEEDNDTETAKDAGSQNWNELLDSYEQYVNKYISFVKKAANGDMNALAEYPALLEKAQDFSSKLENAKGDMSPSQWSRYMRITAKMSQAAATMGNR